MQDSVTGACPLDACASGSSCAHAAYCEGESCYCGEGSCYPKQIGGANVCENTALRESLGMPSCE